MAAQALPQIEGREAEALRGLTAVDGTLLAALPKMAWALWYATNRAVKMHLHFDVLKGVPVQATVTAGNASETVQLRATLQPAAFMSLIEATPSTNFSRTSSTPAAASLVASATTPSGP